MYKRISQTGVALIAVLWVVAFLTTIASTVAHQSRTSLQMTKNRIEQLKLKQAAESAILMTIATKINFPGQHVAYHTYKEIDDINITIAVHDESGKVDLNTAPVEILRSLMVEIGVNEDVSLQIANVILDWRDQDNFVRENGAEDQEYISAGYQYESKDADFERVEELQLIYGMTQDMYLAMLPYVTVHTYDYGVNLSVASEMVRRAVENSSSLLANTSDSEEILDEDLDEFTSLTEGYIYTFAATAKNNNGMQQQISAIIRIDRGNIYEPFTVLSWQ